MLKKRASANRAAARRLAPGRPALHLRLWRRGDRPARDRLCPLSPGGRATCPRCASWAGTAPTPPLKLDHVADELHEQLRWPDDPADADAWREQWSPRLPPPHRRTSSAPPTRWPTGWPTWRAASATPPTMHGARDRARPAAPAAQGLPDRADPRPERGRLRRHLRPDHHLRPAHRRHLPHRHERGRYGTS